MKNLIKAYTTKDISNQRGATNVIICLMITVIMGFAAIGVDTGVYVIEKIKLSNATDAAALAGAQELPAKPEKAIQTAYEYCELNLIPKEAVEILITENNTRLQITSTKEVGFTFAKILGIDKADINIIAAAKVGAIGSVYKGTRPLAIEQRALNYGERVTLKYGGGDGSNGNFMGIALGGTGSSVFEDNLKYGYKGKIKIGDSFDTETGNMSGSVSKAIKYLAGIDSSTFENYTRKSLRVWTIPVVNSMDVNGRKIIQVVGFAAFFVEDGTGSGANSEIIGRFIEFTENGDFTNVVNDYGLKAVKLVQ